jgi:hypothetical protein
MGPKERVLTPQQPLKILGLPASLLRITLELGMSRQSIHDLEKQMYATPQTRAECLELETIGAR